MKKRGLRPRFFIVADGFWYKKQCVIEDCVDYIIYCKVGS